MGSTVSSTFFSDFRGIWEVSCVLSIPKHHSWAVTKAKLYSDYKKSFEGSLFNPSVFHGMPKKNEGFVVHVACSAEVEELFLLVIQDHHAQSLMDDLVSWRLKSIFWVTISSARGLLDSSTCKLLRWPRQAANDEMRTCLQVILSRWPFIWFFESSRFTLYIYIFTYIHTTFYMSCFLYMFVVLLALVLFVHRNMFQLFERYPFWYQKRCAPQILELQFFQTSIRDVCFAEDLPHDRANLFEIIDAWTQN